METASIFLTEAFKILDSDRVTFVICFHNPLADCFAKYG